MAKKQVTEVIKTIWKWVEMGQIYHWLTREEKKEYEWLVIERMGIIWALLLFYSLRRVKLRHSTRWNKQAARGNYYGARCHGKISWFRIPFARRSRWWWSGGIIQHIGAYVLKLIKVRITSDTQACGVYGNARTWCNCKQICYLVVEVTMVRSPQTKKRFRMRLGCFGSGVLNHACE